MGSERKKRFRTEKTLGDIISLVGELPDLGERFCATKEGNQFETGMPVNIYEKPFKGNNILTITDVLLVGTQGTIQRLLQDESTGNIYAINNAFVAITDNTLIERQRGEHEVQSMLFDPAYGILWRNNVCKMRALFRTDDKNVKTLKNLEGVDITPEVPE